MTGCAVAIACLAYGLAGVVPTAAVSTFHSEAFRQLHTWAASLDCRAGTLEAQGGGRAVVEGVSLDEASLTDILAFMERAGIREIDWLPQGIEYTLGGEGAGPPAAGASTPGGATPRTARTILYAYSTPPAGSVPLRDPNLTGRFYYWSTGG